MNIAVIPARGGSKRIPRKNIKLFCGQPMISWSIAAALESECFDRVIVSTDDLEISAIAKQAGAEVPFVRPENISDDYTGTSIVVAHTINWLQKQHSEMDYVCCIYATAPFICAKDIKSSLEKIKINDVDYCFSVASYAFPVQRSIRINENKRCEMFQPEMINERSQDLQSAYHDAGQFYWGKVAAWLEDRPIFSSEAIPYVLPRHRVQDIDTLEDWRMAEYMFQAIRSLNTDESNNTG